MAKKLRTFWTSIGFFEQAVAAPSMKAALEAWGVEKNLFHQGFAKETDDPAIVAATIAKPGVVLKRAVGSKGAFTENPQLPKSLPATIPKAEPRRTRKAKPAKIVRTANVVSLADARAAKQAAEQYDKERARREREDEKKAAAEAKERERRNAAIKRAEAALAAAEKQHDAAMAAIVRERDVLDRRAEAEEARWQKEKKKLQSQRDRL